MASRIVLILCLLFPAVVNAQFSNIDFKKLEKQLVTAKGRKRIDILYQLTHCFQKSKPNLSIKYGKEAIQLADKINYPQGKAYAQTYMAKAYLVINDTNNCNSLIKNARDIFKHTNNQQGLMRISIQQGDCFYIQKNWARALDCHLQALDISRQIKPEYNDLQKIYNEIGMLYRRIGEYDKGLSYLLTGLKLVEKEGNKTDLAWCCLQIGITYHMKQEINTALSYLRKSMSTYQEINNQQGYYWARRNIISIYKDSGRIADIESLLLQYLSFSRQKGNTIDIAKTLITLAEIYAEQNRLKAADRHFKEAVRITASIHQKEYVSYLYNKFSQYLKKIGEFERALLYYQKHIQARDEIYSQIQREQINELRERFDADQKEKENILLKQKQKIQRLTLIVLIIGLAILLLFVGFMVRKYLHLFAFWKKQKYVGQYRIIEAIASGGMGDVYKAHSLKDKTATYAIKVLKEELFRSESHIRRFKREGMIIDRLHHPNIIKIYERGEHEGKLFIVMEYLQGQPLDRLIKEQSPLDLGICRHIMKQIASAMALIHSQEIIHRDIKPANIMVVTRRDDPYFVKLLDFGLSKVCYHSRLTETGVLFGTLDYQAPEQLQSQDSSPASDIYSMGKVFYELVTGRNIFQQDTVGTVVRKILNSEVPPPIDLRIDLSTDLNTLIMAMLNKKPQDRPSAAEVFALL